MAWPTLRPTRATSLLLAACIAVLPQPALAEPASSDMDPWLWLEDIDGERSLEWVRKANAQTTAELEAVPEFGPIRDRILEIRDSVDRIPYPKRIGRHVYNFWQDAEHERGIWRRTSLRSYETGTPEWETVLDLDALAEAEGESWVFSGATCMPPEGRHCMVALSRGGSDATVRREFDTRRKRFVRSGFELPEAKSRVSWKDEDTLWVSTDFGEGSLTTSGYPRVAKEWTRGTPLSEARVVFEGQADDVSVTAYSVHLPEGRLDWIRRDTSFFDGEYYLSLGGRAVRVDLPRGVRLRTYFDDRVLFSLRQDWTVGDVTHVAGSLLAVDIDDLLAGRRHFETLFSPSERVSLASVARTRDEVLITTLDNVRGRLYRARRANDRWTQEELTLPGFGNVSVSDTSLHDDTWFLTYSDFLTPTGLHVVREGRLKPVRSMPGFFDAAGMNVSQHEAASADGTRIPYFVVTPRGFVADGSSPTLMYGYGGFEISLKPRYSGTVGAAWLERGGVYVLANIRGGGEFGPRWHRSALKENRHRAFEDFIAVAEDLVRRRITSSEHLGIMGGSNGGLLVGAVMNMRPDLFKGVVCTIPLLDMRRYHQLLAGASWMAEYGNPDVPEEWEYIKAWSPYHNVREGVRYPQPFFKTTTRDDRVHPGHARKMAAKMESLGHRVYYFENMEGGHGSGTTNAQKAYSSALGYAYLWKVLRDDGVTRPVGEGAALATPSR